MFNHTGFPTVYRDNKAQYLSGGCMEQRKHSSFELFHFEAQATREFAELTLVQLLMEALVQSQGEEAVGSTEFRQLLKQAKNVLISSSDCDALKPDLQKITSHLKKSD
jgi:hypothetical protein